MHDDNQILIPDSFVALCTDARGRLRTPVQQLREQGGASAAVRL